MTPEERLSRLEASMIVVLHYFERNHSEDWDVVFKTILELWPELKALNQEKR